MNTVRIGHVYALNKTTKMYSFIICAVRKAAETFHRITPHVDPVRALLSTRLKQALQERSELRAWLHDISDVCVIDIEKQSIPLIQPDVLIVCQFHAVNTKIKRLQKEILLNT